MRQGEIDALSDGLKRAAIASVKLPEAEVAAWFFNAADGPQFFVGAPRATLAAHYRVQPLFFTPAHAGQEPVAWLTPYNGGVLVTPDRSLYRADIAWRALFLAR